MITHRCLIIEDDINTANDVKHIIANHFETLHILDPVDNIIDAKSIIEKEQPDLVISDINLKNDTAFSLFKQFENISFKIIFITSYSKYAVEAFKFSALDFLEKPFADDALISAVTSAMSIIDQDAYNTQIQTFFHNFNPNQNKKKLVLKNVEAVHIVSIDAIIYIKSDNNYSELYIDDGRKIVISKPLKFYDEQLRSYSFFRTHQSYLVNLDFAKTFHKKDSVLELTDGRQLPVSNNKYSALIHYLSQIT
ncbi:LytTR family DNA-binding domain-containing protein [uncultured Psychroserpens sp.]|uniref:LytR/AlgR family response regulator transcription factor n=1 Tax=uncultured Psychroserpens sp. TaxID=255436 RepID=UPI0026069F17|nr:LytTR family DNA-binding domain-containing protein [uncultured Psychroserpens sp.]